MQFSPEDIERCCGSTNYDRGADYVRKGKVVSVAVQDAGVEGEVAGSGREIYHQSIQLAPGAGGRQLAIRGHCSCPVSYNCKHVAAVLLVVQERLAQMAQMAQTSRERRRALCRCAPNIGCSRRGWCRRWCSPGRGRARVPCSAWCSH